MKKTYKDMSAEECARHYLRGRRKVLLLFTLTLVVVFLADFAATDYIYPLKYGDAETVEIYTGISKAQNLIFFILVVFISIFTIVRILLKQAAIQNIFLSQCDPEKYIAAEKIICKKAGLGFRTRRQKCMVANAYTACGDFEGALKFYEKVMPKDVNKLRDVYILGGLASYYLNLEDRKTAGIYIARLEELKTSGKKRGSRLDMTLNHLKSVVAIQEGRYEEAKALIDSYLGKVLLSNSSKAVNYYNLGLIACETENPAEAIYRLKAAVDLGNHLFFVKDAETRLNEINERFVS